MLYLNKSQKNTNSDLPPMSVFETGSHNLTYANYKQHLCTAGGRKRGYNLKDYNRSIISALGPILHTNSNLRKLALRPRVFVKINRDYLRGHFKNCFSFHKF